jgi:hypothetical protein
VLDLTELAGFLGEHHEHDLIRIETLSGYRSASDGAELDRFRAGEAEPDRAAKAGWLDRIRSDTAAGRAWRRLRVVEHPMTDYVRYSCEWGYTDNSAVGEVIRVLDLAEAPPGAEAIVGIGDVYVLDGLLVVAMRYDATGCFLGAEVLSDPLAEVHRTAARVAWAVGEPFDGWWRRHPEHHRSAAVG